MNSATLLRPSSRSLGFSRARSRCATICSVRARWCIDARYGRKQDATVLLQEWFRDVGSRAGLNTANSRISSGAVGVPESKLELEVTFDSLAMWEQFLSQIPAQEHRAWSQRAQHVIVDGSPRWEIYRSCAVIVDSAAALQTTTAVERMPRTVMVPQQQELPASLELVQSGEDAELILDWKGDPMKLNPGDKLPFKFL